MRIIENLLIMRTRQLQRRNDDIKKARILLKQMRRKKKKNFDSEHFVADKDINKNDFVLLHDIKHENNQSINRKLKYK
jgi:hypothetical protein